jgi:hypothetical protein
MECFGMEQSALKTRQNDMQVNRINHRVDC